MSEQSKKRLVGWKQYLQTLRDKSVLYSVAVAAGFVGLVAFLSAMIDIECGGAHRNGRCDLTFLLGTGSIGVVGLVGVWWSRVVFRCAREIEPVALITRHNTGRLPEIQTLVRASDLPPAQQQTELLRAAGQGYETPPKQLLRATQENTQ